MQIFPNDTRDAITQQGSMMAAQPRMPLCKWHPRQCTLAAGPPISPPYDQLHQLRVVLRLVKKPDYVNDFGFYQVERYVTFYQGFSNSLRSQAFLDAKRIQFGECRNHVDKIIERIKQDRSSRRLAKDANNVCNRIFKASIRLVRNLHAKGHIAPLNRLKHNAHRARALVQRRASPYRQHDTTQQEQPSGACLQTLPWTCLRTPHAHA